MYNFIGIRQTVKLATQHAIGCVWSDMTTDQTPVSARAHIAKSVPLICGLPKQVSDFIEVDMSLWTACSPGSFSTLQSAKVTETA